MTIWVLTTMHRRSGLEVTAYRNKTDAGMAYAEAVVVIGEDEGGWTELHEVTV